MQLVTEKKRNLMKVVYGFKGPNTSCSKDLEFYHCLRELVKPEPLLFQPGHFPSWPCMQDATMVT